MRLKQYKEQAAKMLDVPNNMPISEMLDLAKARWDVLYDNPPNRLEQAKFLHAIAQTIKHKKSNSRL